MPTTAYLTATLVILALVTGVGGAGAAETGTKTLPDSSVNPAPTPPPVFDSMVFDFARHHECYLPSSPCSNNHRVNN